MKLRITGSAKQDISRILRWSKEHFGPEASRRYQSLIERALTTIVSEAPPPGARETPDLGAGIHLYHLRHIRGHARNPRHVVIYRYGHNAIIVLRLLHDAMDLPAHVIDDP